MIIFSPQAHVTSIVSTHGPLRITLTLDSGTTERGPIRTFVPGFDWAFSERRNIFELDTGVVMLGVSEAKLMREQALSIEILLMPSFSMLWILKCR